MAYNRLSLEEKLILKANWEGECLVWKGQKDPKGYGRLRLGGRLQRAQAKGATLPQTKVLGFVIEEIGRMARAGMLYKDVAKAFGITRHRVGQIAIKQGVRRRGISE